MTNLVFSLLPSIRVFQILGLLPFSVTKKHELRSTATFRFVSLLQSGIALLGIIVTSCNFSFYVRGEHSGVGNTVDFLQILFMRFAHLLILWEAFVHRDALKSFFDNLHEVDRLMMKVDVVIDYKKQRFWNYWKMSLAASFYIGVMALGVTTVILRDYGQPIFPFYIFYWMTYFLPYLFSCTRYFQLVSCIWAIKQRFELLNERLSKTELKVAKKKQKCKTISWQLENEMNFFRHMRPPTDFDDLILFRKVYNKLYRSSLVINYSFGLSTLINLGNDFLAITLNAYFIFLSVQNEFTTRHVLKVFQSIFWSFPHCVNIFAISAASHFTIQTVRIIDSTSFILLVSLQAIKTALIVHKIQNDLKSQEQNLFLENFSLQLLHQKIQFTAFGFFAIDFTLLYSIIAAITTYLVILIQFHVSELDTSAAAVNGTA